LNEKLAAPLRRRFFERDPDAVARDLVGTWLVLHDGERERRALLVETEAYGGMNDPASHAFRGPTKRSEIMFGPAGHLYVYLIYGVHWCMNVVTEPSGTAGAVLLRAAALEVPAVRGAAHETVSLRGPGNLSRGLGITGEDNGLDCCGGTGRSLTFHRSRRGTGAATIQSTRIGISREVDRPSRYYLDGHAAVSRTPPPRLTKPTTGGSTSVISAGNAPRRIGNTPDGGRSRGRPPA
jgi:DNA-3-methyladenine glycosylase